MIQFYSLFLNINQFHEEEHSTKRSGEGENPILDSYRRSTHQTDPASELILNYPLRRYIDKVVPLSSDLVRSNPVAALQRTVVKPGGGRRNS